MPHFPAFFDLTGRPVLVVGGGEAAARKVRLLAKAGADITVISEAINEELAELAARGAITHVAKDFAPAHLAQARLVIAATGSDLDDEVAATARKAFRPVNVVDRPDLSDFTVPALVERDDITIGIASSGKAPMLASRIRAEIEALLPPRLGQLAKLAGDFRKSVAAVIDTAEGRRRFWRQVFDGPVAALVLKGETRAAREALLRQLNRAQATEAGIVTLVGAGPGDPDLLTLAAQRALLNADIIFVDDLVAPEVLDRARRDAIRVSVGKRMGKPSMRQDEINRRLIEAAKAGQRVVRLKSGDPFVFGRGGEEIDALREAGIEVQVLPGVTAALGCAASAGIPLTHRDLAAAVSFVSGHGKPGRDGLDWTLKVQNGETVVVYMGLSEAEAIRTRLIEAGIAADLPVALIENGTRETQLVSAGTLEALPSLAHRHGNGPTLLIIGRVAAYARSSALPAAEAARIA